MCGKANPSSSLDLLAIIVESPAYDSLGTVLVCGRSLLWEFVGGIVELFIISPVLAALRVSVRVEALNNHRPEYTQIGTSVSLRCHERRELTLRLWTFWRG